METNENKNITGSSVILTLIILVFVAMGVYFITDTKRIADESDRYARCPYRYRTEVMMKDGMYLSFHGELCYDYDSVPAEDVEVARIISEIVLKKEMVNYTIEEIAACRPSDIEDIVNAALKENNIKCKWYCNSFSSYDQEAHERIEQQIKVRKGISNNRVLPGDSLRIGRVVKEDRAMRHIINACSPTGNLAWMLVFGMPK